MTPSIEQTFFRKLMLAGMISVVLVSLVLVYGARQILLSDMKDKAESMARILSVVVEDAVLTYDYATMERFVKKVSEDPFIFQLRITRHDGEDLATVGQAGNGRFLELNFPLHVQDTKFGTINLIFSAQRLNQITWTIIFAGVLAVILLHGIGFVGNRLVLRHTVLSPLRRLRHAISTISTENLDERVPNQGTQEFNEIAEAFNIMATRLRESFTTLQTQHNHLAAEERKQAAIVASIADGLFVTDENAMITAFNPSAERITGYKRQEAVGQECALLFQTSLCKDACGQMHEDETLSGIETSLMTRDGKLRMVAVSSAVLYDEHGQRCGGVQTFRDITDEKRRFEMFCRTEKMVAIGHLAAGVAHEINNPLANILGYAKRLRSGDDPGKIESRREVIIEQAEKCSQIVRGLLDYSRISDSAPRNLDINASIQRVTEIMRSQLHKMTLQLELELGDLPLVIADARKVEQLLFNLLLNAVQAVEEQGRVLIRTWSESDMVMVAIADDGPGIPDALSTHIFDPFFTTKQAGQGTGLGLAICAGIVVEMYGHIELEQSPLGGAQFTVTLPIEPIRGEGG